MYRGVQHCDSTPPSRASIAHAMRTPRGPSARAKPSAMMRRIVVGEVMFGSCARDDVKRSQRGEIFVCLAQASLLLRWYSKRRLRIQRGRSVLDSRSVATADADPTGVGARMRTKGVSLGRRKNYLCRCVFYARKTSTLQLAGLDKYFELSCRRLRCAMVIEIFGQFRAPSTSFLF